MNRTDPPRPRNQQAGAALLLFLLLGVIASSSILIGKLAARPATSADDRTMQALALARDALLGWSASRPNPGSPGQFPCPEDTNLIGTPTEGSAQMACSNTLPLVGRLPWRTLKLPQLRDDSGEPLWYALSPGFRTSPINTNSIGQLSVDGSPNSAVAVVFAPGAPLAGQNRSQATPANPPLPINYLDGINNNGTGTFITSGAAGAFNDRMNAITRNDVFRLVSRRILAEMKGDGVSGLTRAYTTNGDTFPWAAADSAGVPLPGQLAPALPHTALELDSTATTTLVNNGWHALTSYTINATRQEAVLTINTPVVTTCRVIPGQTICQ